MCQRVKIENHKAAGLLQPLPIPKRAWQHISMDFMCSLKVTEKGNDSVIVFIDRFTKMAHFVACNMQITAEQTAQRFMDNVFKLHGMPLSIVSDRDARFTSLFWKQFFKVAKTELNMSTAFHPQTDGQTERANRKLLDMISATVRMQHEDWDDYLSMIEFACNNAVCLSTGFSPFYFN